MATVDELLAGVSTVDKTLVISNDFRTINIPSSVPNLGVEHDDDVLRLDFKMPRYVSDTDLSTFSIRINYINSQGESDAYTVNDKVVGGDYITFSWLVGPTATRYKGNTKFIVCAKTMLADDTIDKEFNTTIATLPVLEGLEVDETVVTGYTDLIEQWRRELFGIGDTEEASIKAVSKAEQAAIENKGAEVLATIPADYATAVSMTDNADRTKADAIVCYERGEIVQVKDSSDDYLRGLKVFGKTTQVATTGTQLFNPYATQNNSFGNAVVENNGARITVTGTYYVSWPITLKAGVTYYINFKTVGDATNRAIRFEYPDKEITGTVTNPASFTPAKDTVSVYLYAGLGTEGTITYEDVQISEGSSAIPWEPYSGGKPSPSPEYPQALENIGGNIAVTVAGKNLYDISKYPLTQGQWITQAGTYSASSEFAATLSYIPVNHLAGKTITLNKRPGGHNTSVAFYDADKKFLSSVINKKTAAGTPWTINVPEGAVYMRFTTIAGDEEIQIELGDTATAYEAPIFQTITIPTENGLPGIPVTSDGNYTDSNGQQWICDEIDFYRGVYTKRVGTKVFDGSTDEIWYNELVLDNTVMFRIQINDSVNVGNVVGKDYLCSNFPVKNMYNSDVEGTQHTMQQFYFRLNKSTLVTTDQDGFRNYLATHPMTVQYVLATPIETPLTAEEIEWFRFAHTNFPTTTVFNDAGATMELEYNADTKLWLDNAPKVTDEQAGPLVEAWMDEHFADAEGVVYGKSAYEIAVERGFQGSEEYWLASLKGRDGKDGQNGEPGVDGKDGVNGKDGTTPVKGEDYFTQDEKEELTEDVTENVIDTLKSGGSITIDDYVIEQGHDVYYGGAVEWTWRKWASGVAEIWGTVCPNVIGETEAEEFIDLPIVIWANDEIDLPLPTVTYSVSCELPGFFLAQFDPKIFEYAADYDDETGEIIRVNYSRWSIPDIEIYGESDGMLVPQEDLDYTVDVRITGRWKPLE